MHDGTVVEPSAYHTASSPVVEVLEKIRARGGGLRIGITGLGPGALAHYRRVGEHWRYFEIDPLIAWLATDSGYFGMMTGRDPVVPVVLGDARLTLAREPDGRFDLLVLDAFASDSVPTHLLTREAVALYLTKVRSDGIVMFHISNRLLDLEPVLAGAVGSLGTVARIGRSSGDTSANPTAAATEWVAMARDAATLDALELGADWKALDLTRQRRWRDDFSNVVGIVRWRGPLREGDSR